MKNFTKWLDTLIEEKGIDAEETFEFNDSEGTWHLMTMGVVIEAMKAAPLHEQAGIKNMLVRIDFVNASVRDYLKHLGKGMAEVALQGAR